MTPKVKKLLITLHDGTLVDLQNVTGWNISDRDILRVQTTDSSFAFRNWYTVQS